MQGFCLQLAKFIWYLFTFVTASDAAHWSQWQQREIRKSSEWN